MEKESIYYNNIEEWRSSYLRCVRDIKGRNHTPIVISVSRKMPRLYKFIVKIEESDELNDVIVISELAIPTYIASIGKDANYEYIIIDDAMYLGTTIDCIVDAIYTITGQKAFLLPIFKYTHSKKIEKGIIYNTSALDIDNSMIPYIASENSCAIIEAGIPLDMEYPILRMKMEKGVIDCEEKLVNILEQIFEGNTVYSISHRINKDGIAKTRFNATVLFDKNIRTRYNNDDFTKIRFFVVGDDIYAVMYSPKTVSEDTLREVINITNNQHIDGIWGIVQQYIEIFCQNTNNPNVEFQKLQTMAVFANYLFSVYDILPLIEKLASLQQILSDNDTFHFCEEDITYILGPELASLVIGVLPNVLQENLQDVISGIYYPNVKVDDLLIPEEYESEFKERNARYWGKCLNVPEALTVLFSNMHFNIGLPSLRAEHGIVEKLHFGVSYNYMYSQLQFYLNSSSLLRDIHYWIDCNIDEGCVAPKYERIEAEGKYYWKRLFRSGENESSLIKISRIATSLMQDLSKYAEESSVKASVYNNALATVLLDPVGILDFKYGYDNFSSVLTYSCHNVCLADNMPVADYLIRMEYLRHTSSGDSYYCELGNNRHILSFQHTTSLSRKQENIIKSISEIYIKCAEERINIVHGFFTYDKEGVKKLLEDLNRKYLAQLENLAVKCTDKNECKRLSENMFSLKNQYMDLYFFSSPLFCSEDIENVSWLTKVLYDRISENYVYVEDAFKQNKKILKSCYISLMISSWLINDIADSPLLLKIVETIYSQGIIDDSERNVMLRIFKEKGYAETANEDILRIVNIAKKVIS